VSTRTRTLPTSIPENITPQRAGHRGGCLGFLVNNILYRKSPLNDAAPPDDIYERSTAPHRAFRPALTN